MSPKQEAGEVISIKNPLETAWVGLQVGWGGVSGKHQGGTKSVRQVDETQIWHPLVSSAGEGVVFSEKEQWPLLALLSGKKQPHPPDLDLIPDNSVYPHISLVPFKLLPQYWSSQGASQVSPPLDLLRNYLGL